LEPLKASKVCIVEGVEEDSLMAARVRRLLTGIQCDDLEHVSDARLAEIASDFYKGRRGRHERDLAPEPLVILNRVRFHEAPEVRAERQERYPILFEIGGSFPLAGHGAFYWRDSGSAGHRQKTGTVCQPAWQLHSVLGCRYHCTYCGLGHCINFMMNVEEFVDTLDDEIATHAPAQTLFQYDNGTDVVCFEPEYGGSRLLIEHFAGREGQFLELYVGKSANVQFLLDLEHRGRTVCCWSLSGRTQSTEIECGSAPMAARIEASRRCQEAGYHVRHRFSPIVPVRHWREENREMIELLFSQVQPDVITFESIRFMDYQQLVEAFGEDRLDPDFVEVMRGTKGEKTQSGEEVPLDYRREMYRFIIEELERVSPQTPYALCREQRSTWEYFADDFARHGQHPDNYVCNCSAFSAPGHPLLATR